MNRAFDAKLRKVGNSFVVTLPKSTVERFALKDGSFLTVSLDMEEENEES